MLTHDLISNSCCDNFSEMESTYRGKSSLHKNLFNQKETGYSCHSIIQCMENFVEAVHEMDDTILVPSRLLDLKVDGCKPDCKSSLSMVAVLGNLPDLFTLYSVVRNLKNQLQWGTKERATDSGSEDGTITPYCGSSTPSPTFLTAPLISTKPGHIRRPSTASMSSTNSSTASVISEPDSEGSIENDSGIDAELDACTKTLSALDLMEQNFHRHLRGLSDTLNQLTEAARYVTKRYQKDVLGVE